MYLWHLFCQADCIAPLPLGGVLFPFTHPTGCRYCRFPRRSSCSPLADCVHPAELAYRVRLRLTPTLLLAAIFIIIIIIIFFFWVRVLFLYIYSFVASLSYLLILWKVYKRFNLFMITQIAMRTAFYGCLRCGCYLPGHPLMPICSYQVIRIVKFNGTYHLCVF